MKHSTEQISLRLKAEGAGIEISRESICKYKRYHIMLEEFKVSIFAQELGTAQKVSEKRLMQLEHHNA